MLVATCPLATCYTAATFFANQNTACHTHTHALGGYSTEELWRAPCFPSPTVSNMHGMFRPPYHAPVVTGQGVTAPRDAQRG